MDESDDMAICRLKIDVASGEADFFDEEEDDWLEFPAKGGDERLVCGVGVVNGES